jgi:hypothetical protein
MRIMATAPETYARDRLVGGIPTPLKNMSSSVGKDYPIYYGK